jgi:hypothetical protein
MIKFDEDFVDLSEMANIRPVTIYLLEKRSWEFVL